MIKVYASIFWCSIFLISLWIYQTEEVDFNTDDPTTVFEGQNISINHKMNNLDSTSASVNKFSFRNESIHINDLEYNTSLSFRISTQEIIEDMINVHNTFNKSKINNQTLSKAVVTGLYIDDFVINSSDLSMEANSISIENGDIGFFKTALYKNIKVSDVKVSGRILNDRLICANSVTWKYPNQTIEFQNGYTNINGKTNTDFTQLTFVEFPDQYSLITERKKKSSWGLQLNKNVLPKSDSLR